MLYVLIAVACVFAGVAMLASLHTLVRFDKVEKSYENWSQSLSDDCNSALNARYQVLVDAARKDILDFFESYDKDKKNELENDEKKNVSL